MYRVKAIPKHYPYEPLYSWHDTKDEAIRSARICRVSRRFKSVRVEREEEK